jgi:hypothetical protein
MTGVGKGPVLVEKQSASLSTIFAATVRLAR